jgi:ubiquinone/menaquinone biosynthesis C-methylase UbiE
MHDRVAAMGWARPSLLLLLLLSCAVGVSAQAQNDDEDARRLTEVLSLASGSVVADIGAGEGALTRRVAAAVGSSGKVYSTDVSRSALDTLRDTVGREGLSQVEVIEGASHETNLPERCCDAIFMRHVYHHFADTAAMNRSVLASLRPGARLAVVDFAPRSGGGAASGSRDGSSSRHGVLATTVVNELRQAGFIDVEELPWSSKGYFLVVGRRPQ